jgi:hypothetical protein
MRIKITSIVLSAFMLMSIFATGCGYKDNGESSSKEEKTTTTEKAETTTAATTTEATTTTTETTTADTSNQNLIDTMSSEEIVKLNKFFEPFCYFVTLKYIKDPADVFIFGMQKYHDGKGEYSVAEELVEENIKRYFTVETIDHESVGFDEEFGVELYKDGNYFSGGGIGAVTTEWYNVYDFRKNSDGTYTAKLYYLYWEGAVSDGTLELPENYYDRIDRWDMGDFEIVENIDNADTYTDPKIIQILSDNTVVLSPYTVDGEESWRIESINGFEIPKDLSFE